MAATPTSLVTSVNSYQQIASSILAKRIMIWLLQQIAGNTMTPTQLVTQVNSYQQIHSESLANLIIIYLLNNIAGGGGISGGNLNGVGSPTATGATATGAGQIYFDTTNPNQPNVWYWTGSAWVEFIG